MTTRRIAAAGALAAVAVLGLGACSSHSDTATSASPTAIASLSGTAADIAFAQAMIPHHEQAVEMADMALAPGADASPQVQKLARQIKAAQDPEIQQMTTWLQEWGAPTAMPGASGDMHGMDHGGHDMGGMSMSGMMTAEQMQQLSAASGPEFDRMWLTMMIAHHEGAVEMADQVKVGSDNPDVTALADEIISAQKAEIAEMKKNLASS